MSWCRVSRNTATGNGGGIESWLGTANITNSLINYVNKAGRDGGGLYVTGGKADLAFTTISDNEAISHGAGVYNNGGDVEISHSKMHSNTAGGFGGGIASVQGSTNVTSSKITSNVANWDGGGGQSLQRVEFRKCLRLGTYCTDDIFMFQTCLNLPVIVSGGKLAMKRTSIADNTAVYTGGGLRMYLSDVVMENCTLRNNTAGTSGGGLFNLGS